VDGALVFNADQLPAGAALIGSVVTQSDRASVSCILDARGGVLVVLPALLLLSQALEELCAKSLSVWVEHVDRVADKGPHAPCRECVLKVWRFGRHTGARVHDGVLGELGLFRFSCERSAKCQLWFRSS